MNLFYTSNSNLGELILNCNNKLFIQKILIINIFIQKNICCIYYLSFLHRAYTYIYIYSCKGRIYVPQINNLFEVF